MSSILTNNSAMVALQTMKKINSNMAMTQSEISTGKSVASAKDNAAVWAISKVMESDVKGFKGISDSLNLGSSTVAVAREAVNICLTRRCSVALFVGQCSHGFSSRWAKTGEKHEAEESEGWFAG